MAHSRDVSKVVAAKRRGKHCGGVPVRGYNSSPDKPLLVVNESEAEQVRTIFECFLLFGSAKLVAIDINRQGFRTKSWITTKGRVREGKSWNTAQVYRVLNNVLYIGKVSHKGTLYDGEQSALISQEVWDRAHAILESNNPQEKNSVSRTKSMALLRGVVRCGHCDCALEPSYTTSLWSATGWHACWSRRSQ